MKVYEKIVVDMASGAVLYEDSYEYDGPVDYLKGGDNEVKETSQERTLASISMEQWKEYETRFKPFEDKWIADTKMDKNDEAKIAGQVGAGVGQAYDSQQREQEKQLQSGGIDPSSGRYKAAVGGLNVERGATAGKAIGAAKQAVDDQSYQGLQSAISMGRGQSAGTLRDMTTLARDATTIAANDAVTSRKTKETLGSTLASTAGMGLAGWQNSQKPTSSTWIDPDTNKPFKG